MNDYFKPWRRKLGLLMLVMACLVVGVWIRSSAIQDWYLVGLPHQETYVSPSGLGVVTRGSTLVWLSSTAKYGFVWSREQTESSISWLAGWKSWPTDDEFNPTTSHGQHANSIQDSHFQLFGFELGYYHGYDQGEYETFSYWRIPYSTIAIPLTVISLLLLVDIRFVGMRTKCASKTKDAQGFRQSPPTPATHV